MSLTVRDIMDADPVVVFETTPVEQVIDLMRENDLSGLPVINDGGRCVGIITENDLVMAGEEEDLHLPHFIQIFGGIVFLESMPHFEERLKRATAASAKDMMTAQPKTIGPGETVHECGRVMAREKHNRLPVVEHGQLVGMVTRVDVLDGMTRD